MHGSRPRLIASDLDGTLLRSDGSLSRRSAAAWAAAEAAGIETVIVTARPPRWLHGLTDLVGERGIAICGNGAFVYEVVTRRLVETHTFDAAQVASIVADLRHAVPGITFAAERADGPVLEPGFPDPHDEGFAPCDIDLAEPGGEPIGKLLALAPQLGLGEFLEIVESVVADRGLLHFSGAGGLAEINAPGVTKAAALARWSAELDIGAEHVWAFGDMPNDLPMIEWAGVGWAVANGHEQVRAAADRICPANDQDGVAQAIETLLG